MTFSRRSFLRLTLGAGLLASSGYILKDPFLPAQLYSGERETLEAFLDTLIPSDETPGALQLGVARKVLAKASEDNQYRRLIRKGCAWLDRKAKERGGTGYAKLGERAREEVAAESAVAPAGSVARIFFERVRSDAFFHYYACPASWAGLGYKGPPQPHGYPDYNAPQSAPL
jgi:Gluconate 2-dehydrogenase subunit 3